MRIKSLGIIGIVALLSACSTYSDQLENKLAGKSPEERKVILAQECHQEIQGGLKPDNPANVRHFDKINKLCEELSGQPIAFKGNGAKDNH